MKCNKCTEEINPLRIKALPGTKTCVKCSTTSAWYVRNVIAGKTELDQAFIKNINLNTSNENFPIYIFQKSIKCY